MLKALRVRLLFYQNVVLATTFINFFGCYLLLESGTVLFIIPVFSMKVITNILIGAIFHFFKQNQLYFFQNLGVSTFDLYSSAFGIDMTLWFGVTLLTLAAL